MRKRDTVSPSLQVRRRHRRLSRKSAQQSARSFTRRHHRTVSTSSQNASTEATVQITYYYIKLEQKKRYALTNRTKPFIIIYQMNRVYKSNSRCVLSMHNKIILKSWADKWESYVNVCIILFELNLFYFLKYRFL